MNAGIYNEGILDHDFRFFIDLVKKYKSKLNIKEEIFVLLFMFYSQ